METIDFRPELAGAFKALNAAWISKFFVLEPKDLAWYTCSFSIRASLAVIQLR